MEEEKPETGKDAGWKPAVQNGRTLGSAPTASERRKPTVRKSLTVATQTRDG